MRGRLSRGTAIWRSQLALDRQRSGVSQLQATSHVGEMDWEGRAAPWVLHPSRVQRLHPEPERERWDNTERLGATRGRGEEAPRGLAAGVDPGSHVRGQGGSERHLGKVWEFPHGHRHQHNRLGCPCFTASLHKGGRVSDPSLQSQNKTSLTWSLMSVLAWSRFLAAYS